MMHIRMDGNNKCQVSVRFVGEDGGELGGAGILLSTDVTTNQLQILCNQLLENGDDPVPISFFTEDGIEIIGSIQNSCERIDFEKTLCLLYQPQAVFRVSPVTRCSASMPGHSEPVISAQFSPDGSFSMQKWAEYTYFILFSRFLASAGKDSNIHIWDTVKGTVVRSLTGHTACVTSIRWGGEGLIYSGSQDRSIKVWRADDGIICRNLLGHAHWINTLALNTDYVLRSSCFDPANGCKRPSTIEECQKAAQKRYDCAINVCGNERLVSGSDDFTMFLWNPTESNKSIARMTGHQQLVNQVVFSPDTRYIASASFDKSVKIWCGRTGKYLASLRGHVNAVYQVSWSADSRLLVSGSADSTLNSDNTYAHFQILLLVLL
uniref:WD_REPEATS_REGION domain-containing protein n=1 Tax=Heterorhabditis bacteriophora TaxID=37862 RepID=A0A1I7XI27_HETBA